MNYRSIINELNDLLIRMKRVKEDNQGDDWWFHDSEMIAVEEAMEAIYRLNDLEN